MKRRPAIELITIHERELDGAGACERVRDAAGVLHGGDVLQLRIEPRDVAKPVVVERARVALDAIRRAMVQHSGLPGETYIEVDDESYGTPVAPFQQRRFLLPHQDGGHCSFLTPSRLDCPDLRGPACRPDGRSRSTPASLGAPLRPGCAGCRAS